MSGISGYHTKHGHTNVCCSIQPPFPSSNYKQWRLGIADHHSHHGHTNVDCCAQSLLPSSKHKQWRSGIADHHSHHGHTNVDCCDQSLLPSSKLGTTTQAGHTSPKIAIPAGDKNVVLKLNSPTIQHFLHKTRLLLPGQSRAILTVLQCSRTPTDSLCKMFALLYAFSL